MTDAPASPVSDGPAPGTPARVGHVWLALILCSHILVLFAGLLAYQVYQWQAGFAPAAIAWADILPFLAIGFVAQLVDAAIGMGFGVITSTALIAAGMPPQRSTALIHSVEVFGSGLSAISHIRQRNIDWGLFMRLVAPGILGAAIGAVAISYVSAELARPVVLLYLAAVGVILIVRGYRRSATSERPPRFLGILGFGGGFFDVAGGGGWGPIVGGSLVLQRKSARFVAGTVNLAEFFVTVVSTAIFVLFYGVAVVSAALLGLIAGAVIGAPLGARLTGRLPHHTLSLAAGLVLIAGAVFGLLY